MLTSFSKALNHPLLQSTQCVFCLQCKNARQACCSSCYAILCGQHGERCQTCYLPLAEAGICGECQKEPPHFDRVICLNDYQWPLEPVIKAYKYGKQQYLAKPLSRLLLNHTKQQGSILPEAFLPVPLHWFKQWRRGFNQSELLASSIAKQLNKPMCSPLVRKHYGISQASLNRQQRQRALTASFSLKHEIQFKHWVLVDDVVTTGSTANVIAKMLKQAGAEQVDVWAIARTDKPKHKKSSASSTSRAHKKAVQ
ncbi:ComF family protein [Agarivorans sp. 1_MG-2023]|uniref:ComF family protein n=1 Tax=Agarivorans sp. 1_MG-2023 TaxID=3062634 RepID=UPI0026E1D454|nr:ComF family protein [Agarivorans sp. 1_MG-2023]MDO6763472.1 ComF family protein [Agarivorans sp. 1_MG-2023]